MCVVDERGRIVEGRRFRHDERGIRALCSRLVRLGVALVALERPDGVLIERLLDAGLSVVAVHPNQVKAMGPRYSVAAGKSDGFDSFVLAELARTDSHRFRVLVPDSDRTKALRSMTRAREDLVRTRVALANQLRDELACFWPGASKVFCAVDSPIALAFLRRYPSPADARGLGEQRLGAFLARQGYPGRKPAPNSSADCATGRRPRRRARDARPPPDRPRPRRRAGTDCRRDCRADRTDPPSGRRSPRRSDVPLTVHRILGSVRRGDDRRDRRLPRALPQLPSARRRRRPSPPSRSSPAKPNTPSSDGPATTAYAKRSASSRTQAADTTPGPPTSTTAPEPAAPATNTPPASSAARGARSSGGSGTTTTPTTQLATPPDNASSPRRPDRRRSTGPTSPPPSDGSAPPSPQAARRAERAALDGKPTDATAPRG